MSTGVRPKSEREIYQRGQEKIWKEMGLRRIDDPLMMEGELRRERENEREFLGEKVQAH